MNEEYKAELDLLETGKTLLKQKCPKEALVAFREALHLVPDLSEAWEGMAQAFEQLAQQRYDAWHKQAQECYEKAKKFLDS